MKTVSSGLAAHLQGEVTSLATCWRLERLDGWVRGFTDHDVDLTIDGLAYVAATGFLPSAVRTGADLSADNLDVEGFLDDAALKAEDMTAGLFDGARIEVFLVNWRDLAQGRLLLRKGFLGEVKRADQRFSAEIRGLSVKLQQTAGLVYSRLCRTDLGSAQCGVSLAGVTDTLTVTGVSAADTITTDSTRPSGWYTFGRATFLSGANAGIASEVLLHGGATIQFFTPLPRPIAIGDSLSVTAGCDKTIETCQGRFANVLNFRGEPHIPGNDKIFSYPVT